MYRFSLFSEVIAFALQEIEEVFIGNNHFHDAHKEGLHGRPPCSELPEDAIPQGWRHFEMNRRAYGML